MESSDGTCSGWRPGVPVRLFASRVDREVAVANSRHCLRDLRASGVGASLTYLGDVDHMTSPRRSLPKVFDWFTSLRGAGR
ncbi:hypothetical protein [Nonomuraea sp. NPDC050786]|uniref:hypothetical protein n=1 Tax=Nonomuraea sp. NPDC050786 TaxID=3154840 RepID=UPI0033F5DF61